MTNSIQSIAIRIQFSGEAGEGILTAGDILVKSVAQMGYYGSIYKSIPPNIRGGNSRSLVTISNNTSSSPVAQFSLLFAFNGSALQADIPNIDHSTIIIADSSCTEIATRANLKYYTVPLSDIAKKITGTPLTKSSVSLGITALILGIPLKQAQSAAADWFLSKSKTIAQCNSAAVEQGYSWAAKNLPSRVRVSLPSLPEVKNPRILIMGNHAIALGAMSAGCNFFASYPITPATSIGDFLSEHMPSVGGCAYQAEDEISALGAVIGASFTGAKAMTATSGPGLSLMQEFLGYASMTELPLVLINVQRAGPSTGMPTKHAQDDLMAAIFGGHGDSERIVLAPISVQDCFYLTIEAFNLAEQYQCPVIVLSDSALAMIKQTITEPTEDSYTIVNRSVPISNSTDHQEIHFERYFDSESGLNPVPVPGKSRYTYRITGVEHDSYSTPGYSPSLRITQVKKRARKLNTLRNRSSELVESELFANSIVTLISWGLSALITKEAVASLRDKGYIISAIYPRLLYPFPSEHFNILKSQNTPVVIIESNYTGQFARLLRMHIPIEPISITQSSGEPFLPEEIVSALIKLIKSGNKKS